MTPRAWALPLCAGVNLYLLGVMVLFASVVYPQLASAERGAFPPLYQAFTGRIPLPVVVWELVALLATFPLYAARPPSTPLWAVHALVGLGVLYFAITFGVHLPAHRALAAGDNSATAMAPLLASQWARTAVQGVRAALLLGLCARATGL